MKYIWLTVGALAMAGCNLANDGMPEMTGTCGAERLQHVVGKPRSAFDAESINGPLRILPPGAMRTMEHRRDRLNVELSKNGQITRIWCG